MFLYGCMHARKDVDLHRVSQPVTYDSQENNRRHVLFLTLDSCAAPSQLAGWCSAADQMPLGELHDVLRTAPVQRVAGSGVAIVVDDDGAVARALGVDLESHAIAPIGAQPGPLAQHFARLDLGNHGAAPLPDQRAVVVVRLGVPVVVLHRSAQHDFTTRPRKNVREALGAVVDIDPLRDVGVEDLLHSVCE